MKFLKSTLTAVFLIFVFKVYSQETNIDTTFGFFKSINGNVNCVVEQSDGKILVAGSIQGFGLKQIKGIFRLNADGTLDNSFDPGAGTDREILTIALQPDGKILVGGKFDIFNNYSKKGLVRLNPDGSLDHSFNVAVSGLSFFHVYTLGLQTDGSILIAGMSHTPPDAFAKYYFRRLLTSGAFDNTFTGDNNLNGGVNAIKILTDGKIYIGGAFSSYRGSSSTPIIKLNTNGSRDYSFSVSPTDLSSSITSIDIQPDLKVIVTFSSGLPSVKRFLSNGILDTSFNTGSSTSSMIYKGVVLNNGKILLTGVFNSFNGTNARGVVRLNADGSVDSFNPFQNFYQTRPPKGIVVLSNDEILLTGGYHVYEGKQYSGLVKIKQDDSIDETIFSSPAFGPHEGDVEILEFQNDGKILVGGFFNFFNGYTKPALVRLNPDGSIDNTFNTTYTNNHRVTAIYCQPDGKVLVSTKGYESSPFPTTIVRHNSDGSIDNSFTPVSASASRIQLLDDGRFLVSGSYNGKAIFRLNADGSIDNTFTILAGVGHNFKILPDRKVLLAYTAPDYVFNRERVIRLMENGTIDPSFNITRKNGGSIFTHLEVLDDGRIIVGGPNITQINSVTKNQVARLNSNGSLDPTFTNPYISNNSLHGLALQEDGKILLCHDPSMSNAAFARLNLNGTRDNSFVPASIPEKVVVDPAGRIYIFTHILSYGNVFINNFCRLNGNSLPHNIIRGKIYTDENSDCNKNYQEPIVPSIIVKAQPGDYFGYSDLNGNYKISVDSGSATYTITTHPNSFQSKYIINQCSPSRQVSLEGTSKDTCCLDFAHLIKSCSHLTVNVESNRRRRCFKNYTYVNYCNEGTVASANTQIKVFYPEYVEPLSSTPMWSSRQDSLLIFDIGTLNEGVCGQIVIIDSVICGIEDIRGMTQCTKAEILPKGDCDSPSPLWDHSSVSVSGYCTGQTAVCSIKNNGSGDMADSSQFRIFINDTLIFIGKFKLTSGNEQDLNIDSEGKTVRLEADQVPYHPGNSTPKIILQSCNIDLSSSSFEHVSSIPQDDNNPEIAISCLPIIDSYDPNDKAAAPIGLYSDHYITSNDKIEYTIRFQNTGSDTAYYIRIVDTLDSEIDFTSYSFSLSSHSCRTLVTGKQKPVITYYFDNINLPPSSINEEGSNGFIKFSVKPVSTLSGGDVINNKAFIYFDYNSPIITNSVTHTINNDAVITDFSKNDLVQLVTSNKKSTILNTSFKVYPNPAKGEITIQLHDKNISEYQVEIISLTGESIASYHLKHTQSKVSLDKILSGIYLIKISTDKGVGFSKLSIY